MRRVIPAAILLGLSAIVLVRAGRADIQTTGPTQRERAYRENNIGVARLEQFEYREAAASFERAIGIDPSLAIAHLNLAIASLYDSQLENADREALLAGDAMPNAPQPAYLRGLIARAAGRESDAANWFRRVLALDPADVGGRIQLGQVLLANREYTEAAAFMQQALNDEPFNATAAYGLAIALARAGRADEGREAMARFQQLRDNPASITYANVYMGQGRYAEAVASTGLEPELVDRSVPDVKFVDAGIALEQASASAAGASLPALGDPLDRASGSENVIARVLSSRARTVTLADVDGDGAVDLLAPSGDSIAVVRNVNGEFSVSAATMVHVAGTMPVAAIAGDYDNDGRTDLFVLGFPENRLYRQTGTGQFLDVTQSAGIRQTGTLNGTAAFVDVDHDGDLDIVVGGLAAVRTASSETTTSNAGTFPEAYASASNQLLRNDGNGRFTDISAQARVASRGHAVGIVPTDFDNHRDVDLLVIGYGDRVSLFSNSRDGTFRDVASDAGLPAADRYTAVAAADVNKDGATDFFFSRRGAGGLLAMSTGAGRFRILDAPEQTEDALAAQFVDYDNDGLLDLVVLTLSGARLWRNVGDAWVDVSARALPNTAVGADDPAVAIAFADTDADGDVDAVVRLRSGRLRLWRNDGGNAHRSLRVNLKARVSNRSAVGSKVEIRAGSLREKIETSSATPAVAPADVVFGLGTREKADVVRVLWPAGILQAEVDPPAPGFRTTTAAMSIEELNRKPSSCPYLFYWNGSRFEFLTDFMGGGEMGSWVAPHVQNTPDPDEYVRIGRDRMKPREGRYELRVTNELEEAVFIDRLQLVAVSHPANVEVYPNEGLRSKAAREPFTLYTASSARPPVRAVDDNGRDITERIRSIDRRYVDGFAPESIQGYARPHTLTFSIDAADAKRVLLLLTGWTDYAFSSDNFAASQAGLAAEPPSLQVRSDGGGWRTILNEIGIPVGRPQTIAVDLTNKLPIAECGMRNGEWGARSMAPGDCLVDLRIVTNMRVYWDQILVDTSEPAPVSVTRIDPRDAALRWRGYSAETSADGREPFGFDYERVSATAPWKTLPGKYTRFGDVRSLLSASDDRFVISAPGDEIAVSFDAAALPNVPAGWTRTFLLYADGFSKEMNLHSSSPDRLEPLPFHSMKRYPYTEPERYPRTPLHRHYRDEFNTRVVGGPLPPLSK